MPETLTIKDHSYESQILVDRVVVGVSVILVLLLVLLVRLFYLQVIQHGAYTTLSDNNRIHTRTLQPVRGLILDRHGQLIADNVPAFTLALVKEYIKDLDLTVERIRQIIPVSDAELQSFKKRLKQSRRPFESVPLLFKLDEEEIARISVNLYDLPGVGVEARLVRHYPLGPVMAHAVGSVRRINMDDMKNLDKVAYSGTDHMGKRGVEKFYEHLLLGRVGYQRVESNARGRILKTLEETLPVPGLNLKLHVDTRLQRAAIDALEGRRGVVVAIEPATGGILAMVSNPSYDPNLFISGIDQQTYAALRDSRDTPLFNRALQGQYEPGSTLKPFIALAALEGGFIDADYTIQDPGWFKLPMNNRLYRDWNWTKRGYGGHGQVHLQKSIYRSCNVYYYELATRLGIDSIHSYLSYFGFGEVTSVDLPEAKTGLLPSREWKRRARKQPWYPGDTVNMGIGQGSMLVTPLQLATAVAVLANRGRFVQPRMLMDAEGGAPEYYANMPDIQISDEKHWHTVLEAMQMVVHRGNQGYGENGTAWAYIGRKIDYQMAGKSGTAQVVGIKQGEEYEEEELDERLRKHAWFVAFAPYEQPGIAIAVLVENGGGGSSIAAPVVKKIVDSYLLGSG